jgi:hypothetical protein
MQLLFGHELGGNRESADLVVADQYRLAAAQRRDCVIKGAAGARLRCRDAAAGRRRNGPRFEHFFSPCRCASYAAPSVVPANLFAPDLYRADLP